MRTSITVFFLCQCSVEGLSQTTSRRPIRRVAVVGSGIAGLSLSHALTNSVNVDNHDMDNNFEVSIFDSRRSLDTTAGAGIQLNGGLQTLGLINPKVQEAVKKAGLPMTGVQSRAKPWNDKDSFDTLLELHLRNVVESAGPEATEMLISDKDDTLLWTSIMRGALQQALVDTLPTQVKNNMSFGKTLTQIVTQSDGSVTCEFADGTQAGPFDLVVGCDGVKSACKEYIETGKISADSSSREGSSVAIYSGIRIVYAVKDGNDKEEQVESTRLTQYFGDGAYCLEGTYGAGDGQPNSKCAFLIVLDDDYVGPFKKKEAPSQLERVRENADWSQDVRAKIDETQASMLRDIQQCGVPDFDIAPIISSADRFFELGVYFHNPIAGGLAGWSKHAVRGNANSAMVVLCGDAAHTLPPFLGQGSNQAIQDAYCLASKIKQFNRAVETGDDRLELKDLVKEYEKTRWPATFQIFWKSLFLGYLETGGTGGLASKFRDIFFKTMGLLGVAERVLMSAALPKL